MIIGITGTFAAGKDTLGDYLEEEKGFEHLSLSDIVRIIAKERNIEPTRDNMRELGNKLRDEFGPDYLAKYAIEKQVKSDKVVISSIRQPAEIVYLKSLGDFHLIAVDAPIELRFERMQERARPGDPETIDDLRERERKEMEKTEGNAQRIKECMDMADYYIVNDTSIKSLDDHAEEIYQKIIKAKK